MLQQRPSIANGCAMLLDPSVDSVVLAACQAALKLRMSMNLVGKPAPEALAACLGNHFAHPETQHGDIGPVSFVSRLAEQHLAPAYVERAPADWDCDCDAYTMFGAAFSRAYLLVNLVEAA